MNSSKRCRSPFPAWGRGFRTSILALGLVCFLAGFLPDATRAGRAKVEIKIATLAPDGTTWMKTMRALDKEVRAATENYVGLRFYPGGVHGDEPVVLRKIRTGQLHGAGFTGVGLGEIAPNLRVMEIPFLFRNEDEVREIHQRLGPTFEEDLRAAGFTPLGWADVGFVYLYSKNPIRSTGELKSQKVWLWEGDPLARAFLDVAGVSAVPLSITDVMTSLQTGLVSAVYVSPLACIALQWFTRVEYTTDLPITHAIGAVVVSNKIWDRIPPEHQTTVRRLCEQYFEQLRVATIEENRRSMEVIQSQGVQTVTPSEQEVTALRAVGKRVSEDLVGQLYSREILESIQSELESIRSGKAQLGAEPATESGAGAVTELPKSSGSLPGTESAAGSGVEAAVATEIGSSAVR